MPANLVALHCGILNFQVFWNIGQVLLCFGYLMGVLGFLMGVLGYLMGVPIKYPRTPIKYPKTLEAGGRHIGGVWGGGSPPT